MSGTMKILLSPLSYTIILCFLLLQVQHSHILIKPTLAEVIHYIFKCDFLTTTKEIKTDQLRTIQQNPHYPQSTMPYKSFYKILVHVKERSWSWQINYG